MVRAVFLISIIIFNSGVYAESGIDEKVKVLNDHSLSLLGVSIFAVTELINLKNTPSFFPLKLINGNGEIERIMELEKKGYVKSKIIKRLPNGKMLDEEFLWVVRTDEGAKFIRYFENY